MDAHSFLDDVLDVGEVFDGVVAGDAFTDFVIEFFLQFLEDARCAHDPVEDGTGRVGGGIGTCDELSECFSREFLAAELLATGVFALHEAGEEVDAADVRIFKPLIYTGDGDAGEVFDGLDTLAEELVWEVLGVGFQLGEATECARDFAATVEYLNGGGGGGRGGGCLLDGGFVLFFLEHAEGSAESEVPDDVES